MLCLMDTIEKYGHRGYIEGVRHKSRLNHNERIVNVLFVIECHYKFSMEDENVEGVEEDDGMFDGHGQEVRA